MNNETPYNPLDKRNLGASVAQALLRCDVHPLEKLVRFEGAGIYALYYTGDFPAYTPITERNTDNRFEWPIYVGEAIPPGGRKGNDLIDYPAGPALFKRLSDHAKSISDAKNLNIKHFACRFLVVDETFISLGEALMIARFAPLWNKIIDGFGNHNPGKGRFNGMRPRWDVLHPGRPWAAKCADRVETIDQIIAEVETYLQNMAP
jgi:hypothetical protein